MRPEWTTHKRGFPSKYVRSRVRLELTCALGSPIVGLVMTVALAGTAVLVGLLVPASRVRDGVVVGPTTMTSLEYGVGAAVVGFVLVVGLVASGVAIRYLWRGDPVWEAVPGGGLPDEPDPLLSFELQRRGPHPVDPRALGALLCIVRLQDGTFHQAGGLQARVNPEGVMARLHVAAEAGEYAAQLVDPPDHSNSNSNITGISCPTSSFCGAADILGHAWTYDNGSWTKPAYAAAGSGSI